jgi:tetratricopeptide (TPR) repeat protein
MRVAVPIALLAMLAAPGLGRAAGLLQGNHPLVQQGNEAYGKGDYEGALRSYEEAEKELTESPELMYDLGDVYMKLGRTDDAKRAYEAALRKASDSLKPRDYFNLGNSLVTLNQKDDAIAAYRQALKLDPNFEPARRNLEILLRKKNPPQNQPTPGDGGTPDGGGADGSRPDVGKPDTGESDGGADGGGGDGGGGGDSGQSDGGSKADGGKSDGGGQGDGGSDAGGDGGSGEKGASDGGASDGGSQDGGTMSESANPEPPKNLDKQEAQRLLDAMRRNEKQFLMQQHKQKVKRVSPDKDW